MIIGVLWAVAGYVVCELTRRGKLATTVITAAAGALGLGQGAIVNAGASAPQIFEGLAAAGIVLTVAVIACLFWLLARHSNRPGKVYFIASIRQVMADMTEQTGDPIYSYGRRAAPKTRARRRR
jgi:hypothetical protein